MFVDHLPTAVNPAIADGDSHPRLATWMVGRSRHEMVQTVHQRDVAIYMDNQIAMF